MLNTMPKTFNNWNFKSNLFNSNFTTFKTALIERNEKVKIKLKAIFKLFNNNSTSCNSKDISTKTSIPNLNKCTTKLLVESCKFNKIRWWSTSKKQLSCIKMVKYSIGNNGSKKLLLKRIITTRRDNLSILNQLKVDKYQRLLLA